jgi:queuine/archaeosine tRNA-ribosyltransferase
MKPTPSPPRLLPLLSGTAAGSLGPQDLEEIGISAAAVDILELALGLGLERIDRLGGLHAVTGWAGPLLAVARMTTFPAAAPGWRGRALPRLVAERDGILELRSSIDGATVQLARSQLSDAARRMGAEPAASLAGDGVELLAWDDATPPPGALLVSTLAQDMAANSRFWDGAGWTRLAAAPGGGDAGSPLLKGCRCRACALASRGYLAHLSAQREITAEHLLGWHNLHQLRLLVEGGSAG